MFAYLRGVLVEKKPARAVVEAGGFGYEVRIPVSTYDRLPEEGAEVFLHLYPCFREDSVTLYGFADARGKDIFTLLLGVTGVGPKLALTILSGTSVETLVDAILTGDGKTLGAISGVGRKLSQRLIMELREPLAGSAGDDGPAVAPAGVEADAVGALVTLGYPRLRAVPAVRRVLREAPPGSAPSVEQVVKEALKGI